MLLKSFWIALSTYSILPSPQFIWDEDNMKYSICFFPVVGVLCGAALALWYAFCLYFAVGSFLFAAVGSCIGLLLSGGIHMDGFRDTVDALASHRDRERKLEILKDSNCGAFAVMYCMLLMLIAFGFFSAVYEQQRIWAFCPAYVLSRALSGLCAINLPSARRSGMLGSLTRNTRRLRGSIALGLWALLAAALILWLDPLAGAVSVAAALLWVLGYRHIVMKQFGGVTGDTAGFFLQIAELLAMAGLFVGGVFF